MNVSGDDKRPSNLQRRVLLVSNSAIGQHMSGPGIRYWEFARILSTFPDLDVTLATVPGVVVQPLGDDPSFRYRAGRDEADLRALASGADVVVVPGSVVSLYPSLSYVQSPLVVDVYIPLLLEELQRERPESPAEQALFFDRLCRDLSVQLWAGDFILCASEKQRDYWLGALSAVGRINPYTHADDPTLRRLIEVVPFGLPSQPPRHTRQVLKGVYPGIKADDKVLLWGGGLWEWLDPLTLLRAMAHLAGRRPDVKLFFMGVKHLNPQEAQRRGLSETLTLADELSLTGRTVFFNDWVAYEDRANYLLEADVGISLHHDHLESRFSFRTRFLDNLWAGLPLIASRGDVLSQEIERQGLGHLVEPGDVDGLVGAILEMVDTPHLRRGYQSRFRAAAEAHRWEVVTRPLIDFCRHPRRAPDREHLHNWPQAGAGPTPWWRLPGKAWRAWQLGGVRGLARQANQYRRWLLNRWGKG